MVPKAVLGTVVKRKIPNPRRESNPELASNTTCNQDLTVILSHPIIRMIKSKMK
jgi:hypothetical protein